MKGSGAAEFLQRVTAGTVKGVEAGMGRAGLLLNGQSRMIAQFDLLRLEADLFLLAAPESCAEALASGLEALHFSEALEISLTNRVAFARRESSKREASFPIENRSEELSWPSAVPGFQFSTAASSAEPWDFERIGASVPWAPLDWDASTPALEAGMLPWIDREKGCYPGQEVVELSLNVGHPVRLLLAVEGPGEISAGSTIPWGEGEVKVCSAATKGGYTRMFVRLPWAKREILPAGFRKL